MKKIVISILVILGLVIAGIALIPNQSSENGKTEDEIKVGMILNGKKDDHSYSQSHYEAMEKTAKQLNLEVSYKENVLYDETCYEAIEDFVKAGCKVIVGTSFGHGEWLKKAAEKYPEVCFFHATGTETGTNLCSFMGRMYQMRYLSGIVAGLTTKTNEIAYVAAYDISEVNRGINAFALGVKSVNPDAVVHVCFSYDWGDDETNEKATEQLLSECNADILTVHCDSLAPLSYASKKGILVIGYNIDNSGLYPDTFLTAPVWRWEAFYQSCIGDCLKGMFRGKNYWEGIESGMVDLAPLSSLVGKETGQAVQEAREKLEKGTFDVFFGPVYDNQGNLRIGEDESMSDEKMLNAFDWYADGVVIHE